MATRQNNTMQEGLHQLLSSLAQLKAAPDANLEFLSSIESSILQKLREPMQQAAQAMAQAGGVLPQGMGQQLGAPGGAGMGQPPQGQSPSAGMPNPDELRRLVASAGMR
ncbi:MAG: hypothetical protein OTJ97_06040 [SAR202 cluster bacterium]|jgi:hypothetical protein|nr:hypothetical protein [SAR202 cluster bacterium]|tara:strand:- start:5974 stop:6300 length:327 start_codon:yes stop_codon:yes gene_type:complete